MIVCCMYIYVSMFEVNFVSTCVRVERAESAVLRVACSAGMSNYVEYLLSSDMMAHQVISDSGNS